jgi:hypothetical protein
MGRALFLILLMVIPITPLRSQSTGEGAYGFLNLSSSAFLTSLGGVNVSVNRDDASMITANPALLSNVTPLRPALNLVSYYGGIRYGSALVSWNESPSLSFAAGIQYLGYGSFTSADERGNITGEFTAAEYAILFTGAWRIDSLFSAGITVKPLLSALERYSSAAVAFDVGLLYSRPDNLLSAGITARNIGFQLTRYTDSREKLPFILTAGVTITPEHAPLRFSLTFNHLHRFRLTDGYRDESDNKESSYDAMAGVAENIMRHIVIGAELIPSSSFFISAGLNYQRRRELSVDYRTSTVGFSAGFGIMLPSFDLTYSRSRYHLAGSVNNISLLIKPDLFNKRN